MGDDGGGRWQTDADGIRPLGKVIEEIDNRTPQQKRNAEEHARILKEMRDARGLDDGADGGTGAG